MLLSTGVGTPTVTKFLPIYYTRESIFIRLGHSMALPSACMVFPQVGGWTNQTFIVGLLKASC
jgi:hypothetical protein